MAPPRSTILKPLNAGGLWEPVTCRPASTVSVCVAKYRAGVGTGPTNRANEPASTIRHDLVREVHPGGPVVAADGNPGGASQPLGGELRERLPDRVGDLARELVAHGAADVVLSEDGGGELHGARPVSAARRVPGRGRRGGRHGGRHPHRGAARPGDL